jgi:hypothetical protein
MENQIEDVGRSAAEARRWAHSVAQRSRFAADPAQGSATAAPTPAAMEPAKPQDLRRRKGGWTLDDLPPEWRRELFRVRNDFVFRRDPEVIAFTARDDRLITASNDPKVAELLVRVAEERGWEQIRARGSEQFRREVWLAGTARGLRVQGYPPDEIDRVELRERTRDLDREAKAVADRRALRTLDPATLGWREAEHRNAAAAVAMVDRRLREAGEPPARIEAVERGFRDRLSREGVKQLRPMAIRDYAGTLLKHGAASYEFNPTSRQSYFVTLRTGHEDRTIWGVGLREAIEKGRIEVGDTVSFQVTAREPVTVRGSVRAGDGATHEGLVTAHRNVWVARARARTPDPAPTKALRRSR